LDWFIFEIIGNNLCKSISFMYYYKLLEVVYEKTSYKDTIFVGENLWIDIIFYLFAYAIFIS
jgi:hypothetical protein